MNKIEIAHALYEIGELMELLGENPFKIRAHYNAARVVESLEVDIKHLADTGKLTGVKGIGGKIADKIIELISTGEIKELAELHSNVPEGVLDILKISGLGPKKVRKIWYELEVSSIGELQYACHENKLADLAGFGKKSQENILKGIDTVLKFAGRRLLPEAIETSEAVLAWVKQESSVIRAEVAGSVRRVMETVKDVDIVASSDTPESVMDHFVGMKGVAEIIGQGKTKSGIRLESGINVDLRVVSDEQYPYTLHHFTGSREHNTLMRSLAKTKNMKMNEYGLYKGDEIIVCQTEEDIFKSLGLTFITPELREGLHEIENASNGDDPLTLIELSDVKGIFHCHTKYSDGLETVEVMAKECQRLGYEYLGVSDHSQSAPYANGMPADRLVSQMNEIDELNAKLKGFRVFKGVESDILPDGSLDYGDDILAMLDFVIISIHSGFNMDEKKMTDRIVNAIENRYTTMLGHPTGRLLLARDGYAIDMNKIIEACAKNNVIIECNSNPHRLDIDWRWMAMAKKAGVKISLNPDSHRTPTLDHAKYGVMVARKGGLLKEDIFNTVGAGEMENRLEAMRMG